MTSLIEPELKQIYDNVLLIGGEVERALEQAMQALISRDSRLAEQVFAEDDRIDAIELESDQLGLRVLALKAPEARDLRFVTASSKIIALLERAGDHASNIARAAIRLNSQPGVGLDPELPQMAQIARELLRDTLAAYAATDVSAAREIIERDRQVDALYRTFFQRLLDQVALDQGLAAQAPHLVLVAKNLERIGDYMKDICEQIVFIKEGRVIKHRRLSKD
ncbi:MAG TPA: phosphate signaling complex protein PhoU [Blastocatellia bacterium]|nr:phosphate signaling complex protein PhoU [Blastocatellia bacterium]